MVNGAKIVATTVRVLMVLSAIHSLESVLVPQDGMVMIIYLTFWSITKFVIGFSNKTFWIWTFLGKQCNIKCPYQTYGQDCKERCSCQNGGSCNHISGETNYPFHGCIYPKFLVKSWSDNGVNPTPKAQLLEWSTFKSCKKDLIALLFAWSARDSALGLLLRSCHGAVITHGRILRSASNATKHSTD